MAHACDAVLHAFCSELLRNRDFQRAISMKSILGGFTPWPVRIITITITTITITITIIIIIPHCSQYLQVYSVCLVALMTFQDSSSHVASTAAPAT
jgi:hypothetical protein